MHWQNNGEGAHLRHQDRMLQTGQWVAPERVSSTHHAVERRAKAKRDREVTTSFLEEMAERDNPGATRHHLTIESTGKYGVRRKSLGEPILAWSVALLEEHWHLATNGELYWEQVINARKRFGRWRSDVALVRPYGSDARGTFDLSAALIRIARGHGVAIELPELDLTDDATGGSA